MDKKNIKLLLSLIVLVLSIIIGFALLSFVYNGNPLYEAIVAIIVLFIVIVLIVIIKNFYETFTKK